MFTNTNKDASLKFRLQEARMFDNAMQHYWKLLVERFYYIVSWLGGRMHFAEGGKVFMKTLELADGNQQ